MMSSKDVGIRIRVEKELRDSFQEACMAESRKASDLLREFMRSFADQYGNGKQAKLFARNALENQSRPQKAVKKDFQ